MDTGFRRLGPGAKLHRIKVDSSATNLVVLEKIPNHRINLISSSLSAGTAGVVTYQSETTDKLPNEFKTNDPTWVLPKSEDAWVECSMNEDLRIHNPSGVALRGVVVLVVLGGNH